MNGISGDFTGFHFNGVSSKDLGITRVSDGSRYSSEAFPTRSAKTAQNVGGDGTYYWESFYTQKNFTINFAFDGLTEIQKRNLSKVFSTKDIVTLWFDEEPYKQYYVTAGSPLQLKTICFDEDDQRIYKGEGSIQLIGYYPFALSRHKYLNEYSDLNKNEWKEASGMLETQGDYDGTNSSSIRLFNPGDLESDCCIYYNSAPSTTMSILLLNGNTSYGSMTLSSFSLASGDDSFRINSRSNVIEGISSGDLTGHIYNQYISSGDFFKIPLWINTSSHLQLETTGMACASIDYLYVYF